MPSLENIASNRVLVYSMGYESVYMLVSGGILLSRSGGGWYGMVWYGMSGLFIVQWTRRAQQSKGWD